MSAAIVFSCDDAFAPLLKGLVLSLQKQRETGMRADLVFLDFACSEPTLRWLTEHGVRVVTLQDDMMPAKLLADIKPHQRAQICRPYLPDILPQYDTFVWLDSDVWLQTDDVLATLLGPRTDATTHILIAPELHPSYPMLYSPTFARLAAKHRTWFEPFGDAETAEDYGQRAVLNSGVFVLHRESAVWALWRDKLETMSGPVGHISEQTALNAALFDSGLFTPLDPLFNHMGLFAGPLRFDTRARQWMCSGLVPEQPIRVMHLAGFSSLGERYLSRGLLFDQGRYLEPADYEILNGLLAS